MGREDDVPAAATAAYDRTASNVAVSAMKLAAPAPIGNPPESLRALPCCCCAEDGSLWRCTGGGLCLPSAAHPGRGPRQEPRQALSLNAEVAGPDLAQGSSPVPWLASCKRRPPARVIHRRKKSLPPVAPNRAPLLQQVPCHACHAAAHARPLILIFRLEPSTCRALDSPPPLTGRAPGRRHSLAPCGTKRVSRPEPWLRRPPITHPRPRMSPQLAACWACGHLVKHRSSSVRVHRLPSPAHARPTSNSRRAARESQILRLPIRSPCPEHILCGVFFFFNHPATSCACR